MNGTVTKQETKTSQNATAVIPDLRLDDDALTALAAGKAISYIPLGEEQPIKLSVGMITKFIAKKTAKGQSPTFEDCTNFAMLCRARRLNPFVGDCFMLGYDAWEDGKLLPPTFSMIVGIQALLKRAEVNKHYAGMESGIIVMDKDQNIIERQGDLKYPGDTLMGGWAKVYRNDREIVTYQRLQLDTFNKGTAYWKKDPAGQIVKCTECAALRQAFPSDIGGLFLEAEIDAFAESIGSNRRAMDLSPENGNGDTSPAKAGATKAAPIQRRTEPSKPAENTAAAQQAGPGDADPEKSVSEHVEPSSEASGGPGKQDTAASDSQNDSAGKSGQQTAGQPSQIETKEGEGPADYWIRALRAQPTLETLNVAWAQAEADGALDVSDTAAVKSQYEKLAKSFKKNGK